MCKCTPRTRSAPPARARVNFRTVFAGWHRLEVYLDGLCGRRLKKGRQLFWQKSAPPDKILATPMWGYGLTVPIALNYFFAIIATHIQASAASSLLAYTMTQKEQFTVRLRSLLPSTQNCLQVSRMSKSEPGFKTYHKWLITRWHGSARVF